jgi:hypothetical protein
MVCGHLLYFSSFGMFGPRKIWQPWFENTFLLALKFLAIWNRSHFFASLSDSIQKISISV